MQMTAALLLIFISTVNAIALDIRYPQFFHQSSHDSSVEIAEGKSPGSFIAFINVINTTSTSMSFNDWLLNSTEPDFKIQSNGLSYSLITTQTLDRERRNLYQFAIDARHLVPPYESLAKVIRIRILDLNDCSPAFNQSVYQTTLTPMQSTFTVQAFDNDEPDSDNSRITYALSNYQDLFRINESTGTIECLQNLSGDERYEVIVLARDHGKPSLSSTALVQIQITPTESLKKPSWLHAKEKSDTMLIIAGVLAALFVFVCLFVCLFCTIYCKLQRRKHEAHLSGELSEKKFASTSSMHLSTDPANLPPTTVYDAIHIFPNTYYLPLQEHADFIENMNNSNNNDARQSLSSSSSPVSATDAGVKPGSDDGCYCSSDMSSEQSNHFFLLNAASLSTVANERLAGKLVRSNEKHIDGALQRFENLYVSQRTAAEPCASYV